MSVNCYKVTFHTLFHFLFLENESFVEPKNPFGQEESSMVSCDTNSTDLTCKVAVSTGKILKYYFFYICIGNFENFNAL